MSCSRGKAARHTHRLTHAKAYAIEKPVSIFFSYLFFLWLCWTKEGGRGVEGQSWVVVNGRHMSGPLGDFQVVGFAGKTSNGWGTRCITDVTSCGGDGRRS